ncbi:MAG: hypothetical protein ACKOCD_04310 [Nitrospiraceae bacterium]
MQRFCLAVLGLWILTLLAGGWLFVAGVTKPSADGRTDVLLTPSERDQILGEMRHLLQSVHGIVTAPGSPEQHTSRKQAEQAARAAGMGMAADVNPMIMAKLPLAFKQMGMSVHKDFDGLADAIANGASSTQVLTSLSSITSRCTTCHDLYRLSAER